MFGFKPAKRSGHPLEDPAAVADFLAQLPKSDPLAALQQLSACIDALKTSDAIAPGRTFEIVDLVDRAGRPHYRKAAHEHVFGQQRLTKFQEERLWTAVCAYLTELAQGYRRCLAKYEIGAEGAAALSRHLSLITARAVRACAARLKWSYLRYRPIEPGQWSEVAGLYLLAESAGFARDVLCVYRGTAHDSSVEQEFSKLLMLAIASPSSLLPEQIEVAEQLIAHAAHHFVIATHTPDTLRHCIDLRSDTGPQKLPPSRKMPRTARAFGACQAVEQLKALLRKAEERRLAPAELGLDDGFDLETIRATLRHLLRYWDRPLPERRYARERHVARVAVVHDFDEVVANIGGLAHEYPFVSEQESWIAENRSETGLHAMVPSPQGRWLRVGTLVAFREGEDPTWSTGVVRRIAREDDDTRYVAVEAIAHGGSAVTVVPAATPRAKAREDAHLCVWLAGRNGVTDEVTLLLPVKAFARGAPIKIRAYERRYLLAPIRLIESGESYRIARYKILGPAV